MAAAGETPTHLTPGSASYCPLTEAQGYPLPPRQPTAAQYCCWYFEGDSNASRTLACSSNGIPTGDLLYDIMISGAPKVNTKRVELNKMTCPLSVFAVKTEYN